MEKKTLLVDARRQVGTLRAAINYRRSHQKESNDDDLEATYWRLHRIIARGRETLLRLSTFLEAVGDNALECIELLSLQTSLEEAFAEKSKLDGLLFTQHKKGSLTSFKHSVATLVEDGKAPHWIASAAPPSASGARSPTDMMSS